MGNGIFSCKRCNEYCSGKTNVKINNNLYSNYSDIQLDKTKSQQNIITNIFIPNCKLEFSPDNINKEKNVHMIKTTTSKKKHKEKNKLDTKEAEESQNNFTLHLNDAKNFFINSHSTTMVSTVKNQSYKRNKSNNYNIEMLNFLNKIRNSPKHAVEYIDNIIKNNLMKIENIEYLISEVTKEMIKLNVNLEDIKDNLNVQESSNSLKLEERLRIGDFLENIEISNNKINDLIISKKREIIRDYPDCYFYPIFIRDIKMSFILLLGNNAIKDKIFDNNFKYFYATSFNEKNNRFFAILCLA